MSRFINGVGELVTLIGFVFGCAIFVLSLAASHSLQRDPEVMKWISVNLSVDKPEVLIDYIGGIIGFLAFFVFWIIGTAVSAVGQIFEAVLDTAVNTSPFLTPEEKMKVIP